MLLLLCQLHSWHALPLRDCQVDYPGVFAIAEADPCAYQTERGHLNFCHSTPAPENGRA